jgi:ectoine hydroxylase
MRSDEILKYPPLVLSPGQRRFYFDNGYLLAEEAIEPAQIQSLRHAMHELEVRASSECNLPADFEFEEPVPGQRALRQVLCACDHHAQIWRYASDSRLTDMACDLLGPDVRFRESNVSFKSTGGRGFDWHQDIVFFPSSNVSPIMALTFVEDVTHEMGPTMVIPGSHRGEIYDHYDEDGNWLGLVADHEKSRLPVERAVDITGPAGSVLFTNSCILHAARPNTSGASRPMVIAGYNSADTVALLDIPYRSKYRWKMLRGQEHGRVHSEPLQMKMPPDWNAYAGVRIDNLYQS